VYWKLTVVILNMVVIYKFCMRVHTILTLHTISFADISAAAMFQDIDKLVIGIVMMFIYIQLIVSKFNLVEYRVSKIIIVIFRFIISARRFNLHIHKEK
jgi:hypothetical protein